MGEDPPLSWGPIVLVMFSLPGFLSADTANVKNPEEKNNVKINKILFIVYPLSFFASKSCTRGFFTNSSGKELVLLISHITSPTKTMPL